MDLYDGSGHAPLGSNGQVELLYTCENVNKTEQKLLLLEYCDSEYAAFPVLLPV